MSDVLAKKITEVWIRASIPTVTLTRVLQLIRTHHEKYLKFVRYPESKRNTEYEKKVVSFRSETKETLIDLAACKCRFIFLHMRKVQEGSNS